ncbi:efflux RND transporter permease subunit [Aureimonas phyllosphaerae]|uniref:Multidrug efflux pump subunit AcrB n=1 Tax=Aureimonas phyllosphaerae TaxID=1166078 RepID=A0A7W6FV93_9HYPH|nr:efflux RND transporter permease subunit [Aureimonas phyllosphaerae]MBB3937034.1 multidrug efflux pump subunit AcrB [Aureimonas phyllosphaerae]MBB3960851.1 multidrug efflux pump subunit AcrB [Aureimonas phyllosphaerae]SFF49694.1 Multidrug efflux pump subunit AcrB [Aureimonas phyllosphaerae]
MKGFNLSEWALQHRSLAWYFMIVFAVAGALSYLNLGREEDPNFTIKTMIIQANWPGASLEDTVNQVTERIEKKLEELPQIDYTKSLTSPGSTTVYLYLLDTTQAEDVPQQWVRARNLIRDIQPEMPSGVQGPFFNDDFGDVYGNIYALTADGVSPRQLRDYAEAARAKILGVPNVGKVNLIGAQDEVIYLEFSVREIASLGLSQQTIIDALAAQNAVVPSGTIDADGERITVRVNGQFASEDSLRNVNLWINDRFFRLSDVARIVRTYEDPPQALFRYKGEPALGLAIGMKAGANLLEFGEALSTEMRAVEAELPIGVGLHLVSDQPHVVEEAVGGFTTALAEAIVIVLAVSFVSLGLRAGFIVTLAIPLTLAITFMVMEYAGISLQRISLGALIIALGLLVDDAMIAIEMMVARLEVGDDLHKAATYIYTSTAFPMLTGTLVTVASFMPVGLNSSAAGEFTFTLFVVIAVSLIVSWIVAVFFMPVLGVTFMPKSMKKHSEKRGWLGRVFAGLLRFCVRFKWLTILVTVALFAGSIFGMGFVQQQFFPTSDRPEVIVDWTASQNTSIHETRAQMDRFEANLRDDPDVTYWSSYVGQGAVRFVLSFDVQPSSPNYGQIVIMTPDVEARDRVIAKLRDIGEREFVGTDVFVHTMDLGPPVGRPIQYRVSGPDLEAVRERAQEVAGIVSGNPNMGRVTMDWNEPARVVKVNVLQDKARQLGISSQDIASALGNVVGGTTATQIRDAIYLVNVVSRASDEERNSIETLRNLQLNTQDGRVIPLAAVATFDYEMEQPFIWRRDRVPTITVKATVISDVQPATIDQELAPQIEALRAKLPASYSIAVGGAVEESAKGQGPIAGVLPLMLLTMTTILMFQLQSFQRLFMVVAVAPLGLIGVVAALVPSGAPLGFVAILGVLALIGILIRNSVILIVQIEDHIREGWGRWDAVLDATEHRMRPILLTAAAASLALIPISREIFWGPMAFAMMGGIIVGTVLTLLFLPALYVAWFRIKPSETGHPDGHGETSKDRSPGAEGGHAAPAPG